MNNTSSSIAERCATDHNLLLLDEFRQIMATNIYTITQELCAGNNPDGWLPVAEPQLVTMQKETWMCIATSPTHEYLIPLKVLIEKPNKFNDRWKVSGKQKRRQGPNNRNDTTSARKMMNTTAKKIIRQLKEALQEIPWMSIPLKPVPQYDENGGLKMPVLILIAENRQSPTLFLAATFDRLYNPNDGESEYYVVQLCDDGSYTILDKSTAWLANISPRSQEPQVVQAAITCMVSGFRRALICIALGFFYLGTATTYSVLKTVEQGQNPSAGNNNESPQPSTNSLRNDEKRGPERTGDSPPNVIPIDIIRAL